LNEDIEDAAITAAVKRNIITDPLAAAGDVRIETVRNRVYLTGIVPSVEEKKRAHELAIEVPGVMTVVNDLHVREGPDM